MPENPTMQRIRRVRQEMLDCVGGDLRALGRWFMQRQEDSEKSGLRRYVRYEPIGRSAKRQDRA